MALVDLAGVTQRRFGGAGFSLNTTPAIVNAATAGGNSLNGAPNLSERDRGDLKGYLQRLSGVMDVCFRVEIESVMPQHVGLGSKTALLLAAGLACNAAAGGPLPPAELVRMSGRGATSGVGVNTSFTGGFVVDGGRRADRGSGSFGPSSAGGAGIAPPALVRLEFPAEWRIHLFLARGVRYCGRDEAAFFEANTPIATTDVWEVLAAVYHGLAPAVAEADLTALKVALAKLHTVGFKRREVDGQSRAVGRLLELLCNDLGMAAGMSSLGPLVYAITAAGDGRTRDMAHLVADGADYLGCVGGRNRGYELVRGRDGGA